MLCVMHAQLPCHIKWRVKLELAGKENTKKKIIAKNTEILQEKAVGVKAKQKAAPNQSQQYFSGLFQLACRWLHTKSEIATLADTASRRERQRERARHPRWLWWHTKNLRYVPKFLLIWQHVLPVCFSFFFFCQTLCLASFRFFYALLEFYSSGKRSFRPGQNPAAPPPACPNPPQPPTSLLVWRLCTDMQNAACT